MAKKEKNKKSAGFKYRPLFGEKLINKFVEGVGADAKKYFGKDKGCIVGLKDEGVFYGEALWQWMGNKNISFAVMDDHGKGLEFEKVKGRKVLIVDNDIISGQGYKKAMESLRMRKSKLNIKDIKYAVLRDRMDLADFSVEGYNVFAPWNLNQIDGLDMQIIRFLMQDGRKPLIEIAKEVGISSVGIKNRVDRLIRQGVLMVQGGLRVDTFGSLSAYIAIETDKKTVSELVDRLQNSPLIYHLVRTSGSYNLLMNIIASNMTQVERFITKEIRSNPQIKRIQVNIGDLPVVPKVWFPPLG